MNKRSVLSAQPEKVGARVGGAVWGAVGQRLQRKRVEMGLSATRVAHRAGVPVRTYEGYENGTPIPAALLAEVAELLETPLVWFFEGVGGDEAEARSVARGAEPAVFRVATVEQRIEALADAFRQLDFEGQQHLLAISKALCQSSARASRS
jgi:transcriptional regulator with XRE-family HTH domain